MIALPWRRQTPDWSGQFAQLSQAVPAGASLLKAFYEVPPPLPETPLAEVPLAALDLETTGLDPRRDAIVSVGLMPFRLARIRLAESSYWVVKPETGLVPASVTFHHITHSQIAQAPPLRQVLNELLPAMRGRVMVVHYRPIEREFLDRAARRWLGGPLRFPVIDTMQLEARHQRSATVGMLRWLRGERAASLRLADARRRYGLPAYHAHHALTDALATAELLQAQVAHHFKHPPLLGAVWS